MKQASFFVIVRVFPQLEQTHQLTSESVNYESVTFYCTSPKKICPSFSGFSGFFGFSGLSGFSRIAMSQFLRNLEHLCTPRVARVARVARNNGIFPDCPDFCYKTGMFRFIFLHFPECLNCPDLFIPDCAYRPETAFTTIHFLCNLRLVL